MMKRSPKAPPILQPTRILGLDPGGTTGYSVIDVTPDLTVDLVVADQFHSTFSGLHNLFDLWGPFDMAIMEAFILYPWKAAAQSYSDMQTPRFIGAIEYFLWEKQLPVGFQNASQGKGFVTNDKLREWDLYQTSKKHSNDATRHICQYLVLGKNVPVQALDEHQRH